jgi:hypothetical protein
MHNVEQLRARAERWRVLATQMTDAQAVAAIRAEIADLEAEIVQLEAHQMGREQGGDPPVIPNSTGKVGQ